MRVLITGASGRLGAYLVEAAVQQGWEVVAWSGSLTGSVAGLPLQPLDLRDQEQLEQAFTRAQPQVVLHTAARAAIADCLSDPESAHLLNAQVPGRLAELACQSGARLLAVSTDMVFAGEQAPYREDDPTGPLSVYGHSKRAGELAVLAQSGHLVVRLALLYGPHLRRGAWPPLHPPLQPGFYEQQREALLQRRPLRLFSDEWRTPISYRMAAEALVALCQTPVRGILHLGGPERLSRYEMGLRLARAWELDAAAIEPVERGQVASPEPRPRDLSLDSSRLRALLPELVQAPLEAEVHRD